VPVAPRRVRVGVPRPAADQAREIESVPVFALVPDPLPPKLDWRAIMADLFEPLTEVMAPRVLAERIITLHRRWSDDLVRADAPARLVRLLDKVFEHPVVSVRAAGEHLGVSHPTARKDIALFEELGILAPTSDASYGRTWYCPELIRVIETEGVGGG